MKAFNLVIALLLAVSVSTFAQAKVINLEKSQVKWTANKIGGSHNGEIKIKSGSIEFTNGQISGGEVVMDMNNITCLDLEDAGYNKKLVDHLKSDDFFGVEKFTTAKFVIANATEFTNGEATVTGEITIKGKTEELSFDVVKKGNVYSAQLKVDRSKFDVRYGSKSFFDNLGDKAIDDIFILDIKLLF